MDFESVLKLWLKDRTNTVLKGNLLELLLPFIRDVVSNFNLKSYDKDDFKSYCINKIYGLLDRYDEDKATLRAYLKAHMKWAYTEFTRLKKKSREVDLVEDGEFLKDAVTWLRDNVEYKGLIPTHRLDETVFLEEMTDGLFFDERTAIYLYYFKGKNNAEVGEALNMTEGSAKVIRNKAIQTLRRKHERSNLEEGK